MEAKQISSPTGKLKWNREAISKPISNEKYVENILFQKSISFKGCQVKNQGDGVQALLRNHHQKIVSRELFEAFQKAKMECSQAAKEDMGMIFSYVYFSM